MGRSDAGSVSTRPGSGGGQGAAGNLGGGARARWELNALRLVHRVGPIGVGEESVVIVAASGHRAEAFEAARFMIEELKKRVPIWKAAPEG